jgi:hypothetical protein
VLADFGRPWRNAATVLPNEEHVIRRYGRTILVRRNVLMHPNLAYATPLGGGDGPGDAGDPTIEGTSTAPCGTRRHYLRPKRTVDGQSVTEALGSYHNTLES